MIIIKDRGYAIGYTTIGSSSSSSSSSNSSNSKLEERKIKKTQQLISYIYCTSKIKTRIEQTRRLKAWWPALSIAI